MKITLSVALTEDGYMDDKTPQRLKISTPEDWRAVIELRERCDAILVGAETLRRDNSSLRIHSEQRKNERLAKGLQPDITKVTLTRSGNLSPEQRFFTEGIADHVVFTQTPMPQLDPLRSSTDGNSTSVILSNEEITAAKIVTELEKRGIQHLLVEGGAHILEMFLSSGLVDEIRIAQNPLLKVGENGYAPFSFTANEGMPYTEENLGGMLVRTYTLREDTSREDITYIMEAIEESKNCPLSKTCYRVGAVIKTRQGKIYKGYTHETSSTHHAEQEAIQKALQEGVSLEGASIYTSMEPCSTRASEPKSCSELILKYGFRHVAFASYEPSCFVCCRGAELLRERGVDVRVYPQLKEQVLEVNRHLFSK